MSAALRGSRTAARLGGDVQRAVGVLAGLVGVELQPVGVGLGECLAEDVGALVVGRCSAENPCSTWLAVMPLTPYWSAYLFIPK